MKISDIHAGKPDAKDDISRNKREFMNIDFSEDYEYIILDDGTLEITKFKGDIINELVIPNSIEGKVVTSIGDSAFEDRSGLTRIKLPSSLTTIGEWAFSGCSGLTSIELPFSLTTIGNGAFAGCIGLKSINLPNGLTKIGDYVFADCTGLTSIKLPDGIIRIGDEAFSWCRGLTSIELPISVTKIGNNPFPNCDNLHTIVVSPEHQTLYVIDNVLFSKTDNTLICYPAGNENRKYTVPVETKGIGWRAFYHCSLTNIELPNSITTIGDFAFSYCRGLTSIDLPTSLTTIEFMAFSGCIGLTSIKIPKSVTEIGNYAFSNCSDNLILIVEKDSYAEEYAKKNKIRYKYANA